MIGENFQEVLKELRGILSQIKGVKNIGEDFSLNYLILVENEQSKKDAEKVAVLLETQAREKSNIDLSIYVLTEAEYADAQKQTVKGPTFSA